MENTLKTIEWYKEQAKTDTDLRERMTTYGWSPEMEKTIAFENSPEQLKLRGEAIAQYFKDSE